MKKALIFCNHAVPFREPNSIRLINFALILKQLGYETYLFGVFSNEEKRGIVNQIKYIEWSQTQGSGLFKNAIRKYEYYENVNNILETYPKPEIIISALNSSGSKAQKLLREFSLRNNINFVHSIVEWYGLFNYGGFKHLHRFAFEEYTMRYVNHRSRNIIAISSFLGNYYKQRNCNVTVIPAIYNKLDYENIQHINNERLTIVYAGSPRKKDRILNAIIALSKLDEFSLSRIEFNVFGVTINELKKNGLKDTILKKIESSINIYGRIDFNEVKNHVSKADFTILLRPNNRNANAGFSTKVCESMACGTPVIANLTSDLKDYIYDGKTGIVCDDDSVDSCVKAFQRAIQLTNEDLTEMRNNTIKVATEKMELSNYVQNIKDILTDSK